MDRFAYRSNRQRIRCSFAQDHLAWLLRLLHDHETPLPIDADKESPDCGGWVALVTLVVALGLPTIVDAQNDLGLSSKRFIVIDADTGEIIAEQNADQEVAIASLTKMFTTIEALERGRLDQRITTKPSDLFDANSTTMGFGPGETFTLEELLYGMMLPSGNDAAHAVARALGAQPGDTDQESVDRFVGYMNERAQNMGLTNTQFVNPHGWGVDGHYSTARDVATFAMYAMQYPEFEKIIGTVLVHHWQRQLHRYQYQQAPE